MISHKPHKVIIVGAGVSGLSAANFLYRNGIHDILVLEAKGRAGGRIDTKFFGGDDKNSGRVELGAQWIHGELNDFCQLVKTTQHRHEKFSWEGKGDFLFPTGEKAEERIVTEILEWLETTIEHVENTFSIADVQAPTSKWGAKDSMGSFLKTEFLTYLDRIGVKKGSRDYDVRMCIFQWGMSFQRIDNSCNQMTDLSLFRWPEFEVNPGEHYNNFKDGASNFVDKALVSPLPRTTIIYNSPVDKVNWESDEGVAVLTRSGKQYTSECVLITCPMGVLKEIHEHLFIPRLPPNLVNAIEAVGFGPVGKIFLKWTKPWWQDGLQGFQFLWPKEFINCCDDDNEVGEISTAELSKRWPKSITGFDPVLDNPNVLLGWLGGPETIFVESLTDSEIGCRCTRILRDFTGQNVPEPDAVLVSKWNTDEFIRGAYSYRSVKGDKIPGDISSVLSEPIIKSDSKGNKKPVIIFAGEALSKTHYSTLHGAYETGERQAAKLFEYFKSGEISSPLDLPKPSDNTIQLCSKESMALDNRNLQLDNICSLSNQLSQKVEIFS